jgi:hypothetical protein
MAWLPLDEVLAGANAVRKQGTLTAADAGEGDVLEPDAPDADSLPAPSDRLLAASTQPGQQQQQQDSVEGRSDDVAKMMLAVLLSDGSDEDDAESAAPSDAAAAAGAEEVQDALALPAGLQQQQQQQQGRLVLRKPLAVNKQAIARWLRALVAGQAPAPGLQQQQVAAAAAGQEQQQQHVPVVTELPVDWQSYVQPARPLAQPAVSAAVGGATAAGKASSAAFDGATAGQQPWAISIWCGRHARELQEQQLEEQQQEQWLCKGRAL